MKGGRFHPASLRTGFFHATKQMADDKKNIPEAAPPAEAPTPTAKKCRRAGAACFRACADQRRGGHTGARGAGGAL